MAFEAALPDLLPGMLPRPMQSCEQPGATGGHGVGWSEIPRYAFDLPEGWSETPVSIADLGGTEVSSGARAMLPSHVSGHRSPTSFFGCLCAQSVREGPNSPPSSAECCKHSCCVTADARMPPVAPQPR